jgi:hypothetical protein
VATVRSCPFETVSVRLNSAFLHDAIALAEHDDVGLPVLDLMFGDMSEADDGEDVTSFSLGSSRFVEDVARTGIAGDGVGVEAIIFRLAAIRVCSSRAESARFGRRRVCATVRSGRSFPDKCQAVFPP